MITLKTSVFLLLAALQVAASAKVVCYWNGQSFWREGTAKVTVEEVKHGLTYCTHLIYGFAGIDDDDYEIEPLDKKLDKDKGKGQYRLVTSLKRSFPGLTILLSVGGNEDKETPEKYFALLEDKDRRTKFVNSVYNLLKEYSFDGIDLAWQFPEQHEKYESRSVASIWHKFKKTFGAGVDGKADEHRAQFTSLVSEMNAKLRPDGKTVVVSVLPHVNATTYMDIRGIINNVDFINLWTFNMRTPERTPEKADYTSPLHHAYDRLPFQNADWVVNHWLQNGANSQKLILGIPTFGRSWKMTRDTPPAGVPPVAPVDGPGKKGPYTKEDGMRAYFEVCVHLVSLDNPGAPKTALRRIPDPSRKLGTYAFRTPNSEKKEGMWVSFEEPDTAAYKAQYAKMKNLGGVAIVDMGLDDSRGLCDGTKFPILRAAKLNIDYIPPPPPMPPPPRVYTGNPQQPRQPVYPGQPGYMTGYASSQPGQPGYMPGYVPSQPGQPGYMPGYVPAQPGQPGYVPSQLGQPGYMPGYVPAQPGQPGYVPSQPGQPGYISSQPGQPGYMPGYVPAQPGQPGYVPSQPGQPGYISSQPGQPGYVPSQPGQPGYVPSQPGQPGYMPGYVPVQPGQPGYIQPGYQVQPGYPGYVYPQQPNYTRTG